MSDKLNRKLEINLTETMHASSLRASSARAMGLSAWIRDAIHNQLIRDFSKLTRARINQPRACTCVPAFGGIISADCPVHDNDVPHEAAKGA